MRQYDFSPLYRSFVGFDRMAELINAASQTDQGAAYPPYNVAKTSEDAFRIELAVAGFGQDDLEIESHENVLTVKGTKAPTADNDEDATVEYLHRGIAERGFERRFQLADHVIVSGADLQNGLLVIELRRELPEALKPRKIAIGDTNVIEGPKRRKAA
jgi:molecular chaperone IbpA